MADDNKTDTRKTRVEILRKYWPLTATSDTDALDVGTVIDLPHREAVGLVDKGIAKLVTE